jgi:hypothetical protein
VYQEERCLFKKISAGETKGKFEKSSEGRYTIENRE